MYDPYQITYDIYKTIYTINRVKIYKTDVSYDKEDRRDNYDDKSTVTRKENTKKHRNQKKKEYDTMK